MLDSVDFVVTALVLAVGAFTIGAIGFGFGLTTTPFLLLYLDPQSVVIVVNTGAALAFAFMLADTRKEVHYRELTPIAVAGVLGAPVGGFALTQLDPDALRIGIAALVLAVTVLVVANRPWPVPVPKASGPVIGFCASAMMTSLAIGGPLLMLFLMGRGLDRQGMRASLAFFFTAVYCTALVGYALRGLITVDRLLLAAATIPAMALGYWLSVRLTGRMNAGAFRLAVVIVITTTSALVLAQEILGL